MNPLIYLYGHALWIMEDKEGLKLNSSSTLYIYIYVCVCVCVYSS